MQVRKKKVGLALGGGVARGVTHIGVLGELLAAGIPIDYVAGTSAGSLMGATFCAGMSLDRVREVGLRLNWLALARPVWPSTGFFTLAPLAEWLVRILGDLEFGELRTPFAAVATDLETGEPVVLCEGRVAPAVQASCSIPGLIAPVEIGGRLLGDGSLANTVPVNVLREMGADYVIGVDIFAHAIRKRWGPFGLGFNALEILVERAGGGIEDADCLIAPALGGKSYMSFSKREEYLLLGQEAARAKLPHILADLS